MRWLLVLCFFASCSAQWHARKAIKKDADVFDTKVTKIKTPSVDFTVSCDSILKNKKVLKLPRTYYSIDSVKVSDTVYVTLQPDTITNTVEIKADCPDPEIIEKPVVIKPKKWDLITSYAWLLAGLLAVGIVFGLILRRV